MLRSDASFRRWWYQKLKTEAIEWTKHHLKASFESIIWVHHLSVIVQISLSGEDAQWFRTVKNRDVSSVCLFARTAHSVTCSVLLASLARSSALFGLLVCSLTHSKAPGKVYDRLFKIDLASSHSAETGNRIHLPKLLHGRNSIEGKNAMTWWHCWK